MPVRRLELLGRNDAREIVPRSLPLPAGLAVARHMRAAHSPHRFVERDVDILAGTHSLLGKWVEFKDLDLVIVMDGTASMVPMINGTRAGLDAVEIRRLNLLHPGEEVRPDGKPLDADLVGDIVKVAEALGWDRDKPPGTGRGVSVGLLAAAWK